MTSRMSCWVAQQGWIRRGDGDRGSEQRRKTGARGNFRSHTERDRGGRVLTRLSASPTTPSTGFARRCSPPMPNARSMARACWRAGTVTVNSFGEGDISTPFGGYKQSGFGGRIIRSMPTTNTRSSKQSGSTWPTTQTRLSIDRSPGAQAPAASRDGRLGSIAWRRARGRFRCKGISQRTSLWLGRLCRIVGGAALAATRSGAFRSRARCRPDRRRRGGAEFRFHDRPAPRIE